MLDGEIVALDDRVHSDFERLQQRMGSPTPAGAAYMAARVPAHLMLFAVVHLDSRPVTGLPHTERHGLLGRPRAGRTGLVDARGDRRARRPGLGGGDAGLEAGGGIGPPVPGRRKRLRLEAATL
ncbi:hypothetical protein ACFV0W_42040 [Streptomyces anulatus]